jgi:hypothetical protein
MYQLHVWAENLAWYGARELIDPKVTAETWCINEMKNLQISKEGHLWECTYKCFVFVRLSSPRFIPSYTGSPPVSLLSARSNQYSFERPPSDGGMRPVNRLEFKDLQAECNDQSYFTETNGRHITRSMTRWNHTKGVGWKVVYMNVIPDGATYVWSNRGL